MQYIHHSVQPFSLHFLYLFSALDDGDILPNSLSILPDKSQQFF